MIDTENQTGDPLDPQYAFLLPRMLLKGYCGLPLYCHNCVQNERDGHARECLLNNWFPDFLMRLKIASKGVI